MTVCSQHTVQSNDKTPNTHTHTTCPVLPPLPYSSWVPVTAHHITHQPRVLLLGIFGTLRNWKVFWFKDLLKYAREILWQLNPLTSTWDPNEQWGKLVLDQSPAFSPPVSPISMDLNTTQFTCLTLASSIHLGWHYPSVADDWYLFIS